MDTVLAHGCFDLLHLGHIRHLREARSLGDRLVVGVTADRHVRKGAGRPHFSAEQRREALMTLGCVDEVVINDAETAVDLIKRIKPKVYVKGVDYSASDDPNLAAERRAVESIGGKFHVTTAEKWSSTKLLRSVRLPDAALAYVEEARKRGFLDHILAAVERADALRITFVGETIIDEYRYVKPLAKPSKEFILATVAAGGEKFDGGIAAAAKHGGWSHVSVVTPEETVTKTRFVDADFSRKLFEVYSAREIEVADREGLQRRLAAAVRGADVVIAIDFGHGMFGSIEKITIEGAKFLALTSQTNAGNYGFNFVTGHRRADYVCVDEPEARLAARDQGGPAGVVLAEIGRKMTARAATMTRGRYGSISMSSTQTTHFNALEIAEIPAFADSGVDTMGAGDAFIAVAAPLVAAGLPVEMAAFAGNVAGGLKTSIIGHRQSIGRDDIVNNLEWLLR